MSLPPASVEIRDRNALLEFVQEWLLVPAHSVRHNYHRERHILSRYLLSLADAGRLDFPVRLEHLGLIQSGASPDFQLTFANGQTVGIEVTEASTSELHQQFIANEERWRNSDAKVVGEDPSATSPGWAGDSHVREWASLVFQFIQRKTQKLNKGNFQRSAHQDLVVYAGTPAPLMELKPALTALLGLMSNVKMSQGIIGFRHISIITTTAHLVFDSTGECAVLPMTPVDSPLYDLAWLLRDIRAEVIGLLFNRYIFRALQEIVRRNPRLQSSPRGRFSDWTQTIYATANAVAVRRLASDYDIDDVNLLKLLDSIIREPKPLWTRFERFFPEDAASSRAALASESGEMPDNWQFAGVRRLVGQDRASLINAAKKANKFATKRVAHNNPSAQVHTRFRDLDQAIDIVKNLTEKYLLLIYEERHDLVQEMVTRKLPNGWDAIFLEPWATPDTLAEKLGEMEPPMSPPSKKPKTERH